MLQKYKFLIIFFAIAMSSWIIWSRMTVIDFSSPKSVLDNFIRAEVANDLDRAFLTITGQTYAKSMNDILGATFLRITQATVVRESKNESVQKWEILDVDITNNKAIAVLSIQIENGSKIIAKVDELTGWYIDSKSGRRLFDPSRKKFDAEEAYKIAESDPTILPLIYKLTMQLHKKDGKWLVRTDTDEFKALISIIDDGFSVDTKKYLTNP